MGWGGILPPTLCGVAIGCPRGPDMALFPRGVSRGLGVAGARCPRGLGMAVAERRGWDLVGVAPCKSYCRCPVACRSTVGHSC